jgi:hypothetical protein
VLAESTSHADGAMQGSPGRLLEPYPARTMRREAPSAATADLSASLVADAEVPTIASDVVRVEQRPIPMATFRSRETNLSALTSGALLVGLAEATHIGSRSVLDGPVLALHPATCEPLLAADHHCPFTRRRKRAA